jgi:hypothetical protein
MGQTSGVLTFLLYCLHPLAALVCLILYARRLRRTGALRFPLSTALFLSVVMGGLLGICVFVCSRTSLTLLGIVVILGPLPIWLVAGGEYETLRRRSNMIGFREASVGAVLGFFVYGLIVAVLLGASAITGFH